MAAQRRKALPDADKNGRGIDSPVSQPSSPAGSRPDAAEPCPAPYRTGDAADIPVKRHTRPLPAPAGVCTGRDEPLWRCPACFLRGLRDGGGALAKPAAVCYDKKTRFSACFRQKQKRAAGRPRFPEKWRSQYESENPSFPARRREKSKSLQTGQAHPV